MTRDFIRDRSDRGVATMLSLLVAGRLENRAEQALMAEALEMELITRAMRGAKQGDC